MSHTTTTGHILRITVGPITSTAHLVIEGDLPSARHIPDIELAGYAATHGYDIAWEHPDVDGWRLTPHGATQAAHAHLRAIGWRPGDGLTDSDLGLGEDPWGGAPESVPARTWTRACEREVRRLAREATPAEVRP